MTTPLSISCPSCGSGLKIKDYSLIGKKVPCPKCKVPFQIAVRVEAAPVDDPAPPEEREFWEEEEEPRDEPQSKAVETRLWNCPWCGQSTKVPANKPDPASCDDCRAAAPPKKRLPRESFFSKHPKLCIGAVIFGLLSVIGAMSGNSGAPPRVGEVVIITRDWWCGVDESDMSESYELAKIGDEFGMEEMERRGQIFIVYAGTYGLVLESGVFTSKMKIRIRDGEHMGKAGYIDSKYVRLK